MFMVEGEDYTPDGIEKIRQALIDVRGRAMTGPTPDFHLMVLITHAVVLLYALEELIREGHAQYGHTTADVDR